MSEINLKRFVDIDIQASVTRVISGTRKTVILFTSDGTASTVREISSIDEVNTYYTEEDSPTTRAYLHVFFNNGGVMCKVIEGISYSALTSADISALENEEIVVACAAADTNREDAYAAMKLLATTRNADSSIYGINEKILLARTQTVSDESDIKNFAVKYSSVLGAEMTIAAYLSQIDVYRNDMINDYAFTQEALTAESVSDANFGTIITNNMNVDITLADSSRNCGGNLKDGSDLVNSYIKIVLHQTLTERLMTLLTSKIKGSSGISQIYSTIAQELEEYRSAGYLSTDKIWESDDLFVTYNNESYLIIQQGTALVTGYVIKVLPMSSLTAADKAAHKAPPVYVVIADQYGIRQITINGEII